MKHLSLFCLLLLFSCNNNTPNTPSLPSPSANEPKEESILIDSSFTDTTILKKETSQQTTINNNSTSSSLPKIAPQQFTINPNQDTILIGKKGSVFLIPKNSFINKKGEAVTGKINLVLIEAYELEDMLLNNLQTISEDGLLITSGMFSLTAKNEAGQELELDKNKSIYFQTTNKTNTKDQLYTLEEGVWVNPTPPTNYLTYKPFDFYPTQSVADECYVLLRVHINKTISPDDQKNKIPKSFIFSQEFFDRYQNLVCNGYTVIALKYLEYYQLPLVEADKEILSYIKKQIPPSNQKEKIIEKLEQYIKQNKTTFPPDFTYPDIDYKQLFGKSNFSEISAAIYKLEFSGWCNIDRAYPNRNLDKQTIKVSTNKAPKILYLVSKNQAASFSTINLENTHQHTFNVKLPMGEEFYILAANEQNGSINYAQKLITLNGNHVEELNLKPITTTEFSKAMQNIQKGWQVSN